LQAGAHSFTRAPHRRRPTQFACEQSGFNLVKTKAITWANGLDTTGILGLSLSTQTGYSTQGELSYWFHAAGQLSVSEATRVPGALIKLLRNRAVIPAAVVLAVATVIAIVVRWHRDAVPADGPLGDGGDAGIVCFGHLSPKQPVTIGIEVIANSGSSEVTVDAPICRAPVDWTSSGQLSFRSRRTIRSASSMAIHSRRTTLPQAFYGINAKMSWAESFRRTRKA
jgi:hypothetical protein